MNNKDILNDIYRQGLQAGLIFADIIRSRQYSKVVEIIKQTGFIYLYEMHYITGYQTHQIKDIFSALKRKGIIEEAELTNDEKAMLLHASKKTSDFHIEKIKAYRLAVAPPSDLDFSIHMTDEEKERLNQFKIKLLEGRRKYIESKVKKEMEEEMMKNLEEARKEEEKIMEKVMEEINAYNDFIYENFGMTIIKQGWVKLRERLKKAIKYKIITKDEQYAIKVLMNWYSEEEAKGIMRKDKEILRKVMIK